MVEKSKVSSRSGEPVNFFWVGKTLGPIHTACIRSFQRHGHRTVLHCFETPVDVPDSVEIVDASGLMRLEDVFAYRSQNSFALAANIYRYRLLAAGYGTYADCDVFCLRPLPESEWLLGWESDWSMNCALLKVPAESDLVRALVDATKDRHFVAPWWRGPKRRLYAGLKKLGLGLHISRTKWGATGPDLLTYLVKRQGLESKAMPADAFFPLHFHMTKLLFEEGLSVKDLVTPRSYTLHLFYHTVGDSIPPKRSPLAEIMNS